MLDTRNSNECKGLDFKIKLAFNETGRFLI